MSYTETGFFEEALADLEWLKEVDKASAKDADAALANLRREQQQFKLSEKRSYDGKLR